MAKFDNNLKFSKSYHFGVPRQHHPVAPWASVVGARKFFFFLSMCTTSPARFPNFGKVRGHQFFARDSWSTKQKRKFCCFFSNSFSNSRDLVISGCVGSAANRVAVSGCAGSAAGRVGGCEAQMFCAVCTWEGCSPTAPASEQQSWRSDFAAGDTQ